MPLSRNHHPQSALGSLSILLALSAISPIALGEPIVVPVKAHPRQISGHQRRGTVSEPLADYFSGTDLQWYGALQVGTPPQNLTVVFDTGSSDVLIPSAGCTADPGCTSLRNRFEQSKSSTFKSIKEPFELVFSTGTGVKSSDSETVSGTIVKDTLGIAGMQLPGFQFGLITNQTAGFGQDPFDGIVGMAFDGDASIVSQTFLDALVGSGAVDKAMYGLYLTPKAVGNAEISLGGVDESKIKGKINYVPITNKGIGLFVCEVDNFHVNGKVVNGSADVIFDSGTSNVVAPKASAEAIYALISPDIKPIDKTGTYAISCDKLADLKPTISLSIGGVNYTIPAKELSVGKLAGHPGMCQTLINADVSGGGLWVVGGSMLKYYYSVWDIGGARLGLAKTAHSP